MRKISFEDLEKLSLGEVLAIDVGRMYPKCEGDGEDAPGRDIAPSLQVSDMAYVIRTDIEIGHVL